MQHYLYCDTCKQNYTTFFFKLCRRHITHMMGLLNWSFNFFHSFFFPSIPLPFLLSSLCLVYPGCVFVSLNSLPTFVYIVVMLPWRRKLILQEFEMSLVILKSMLGLLVWVGVGDYIIYSRDSNWYSSIFLCLSLSPCKISQLGLLAFLEGNLRYSGADIGERKFRDI